MNQNDSIEALRHLHDIIESDHCGDYRYLERKMSHIIYLLHYLPWETFAGRPVRDIVFLLERLRESFEKAQEYQNQQ